VYTCRVVMFGKEQSTGYGVKDVASQQWSSRGKTHKAPAP
jgi:hypothetical protein